jgi:Domain of unknown function (DUF6378)
MSTIDVDAVLAERGTRYGQYTSHAQITQDLKDVMRKTDNWEKLQPHQKETLEMIAHKIGRALNGDPMYQDNFVDMAGYAKLSADALAPVIVKVPEGIKVNAKAIRR